MDWLEVLNTVISVLGVSGCGILFYRQKRKELDIANAARTNDEWMRLYSEMRNEADKRDAKIDELYGKIDQHRDDKAEMRNELTDLKIELTELRGWRCDRTNCAKRRPPSAVTVSESHEND